MIMMKYINVCDDQTMTMMMKYDNNDDDDDEICVYMRILILMR